ncbi:MAG TPA: GH3 auxin-responsive promoter, partial [Hanamia sp.]|nr:GH3 auxin-responsive promoter [Hanamia sp.]
MAFIDIKFPKSFYRALRIPVSSTKRQQFKVLQKLLKRARFTEFGQKYLFDQILLSKHPAKSFQ